MKSRILSRTILPLVLSFCTAFGTGCAGETRESADESESAIAASGFAHAFDVNGVPVSYKLGADGVTIRQGSEVFTRSFADADAFANTYGANVTQLDDSSFLIKRAAGDLVITNAEMGRLQNLGSQIEGRGDEASGVRPKWIQFLVILVIVVVLLSIPGHEGPRQETPPDTVASANEVNKICADMFVQPNPGDDPTPLCTITEQP